MDIVEVRTRLDSYADAVTIAEALVVERLAAAAHVRGPLSSCYRWQGVVEVGEEWEVDAITSQALSGRCVARIRELHPYDVAAILTTEATASDDYAHWVSAVLSS